MSDLLPIIDRFPHLRIAVWGDFILDEYVYGFTRRISREAPVLILSYQRREFSLGGAGNAALNLAALGIKVTAIGVAGADASGRTIRKILRRRGIPDATLFVERGFATPLKTRILAGEENTKKQQILRIDRDGELPAGAAVRGKLRRALERAARTSDALLISDYHFRTVDEGLFAAVLPVFKAAGRPVALDSRFRLARFPGVTIATPNEPEVEEALKIHLGDDLRLLTASGRRLLRTLRSPALLITRGSKGMALFERAKRPTLIPVQGATDIVDVTGAGDTVISVFTAALAAGASFRQATRLANYAGGLVVMKKGTATVSPQELKKAVASDR
jgi:rfaE bifunctional protein kinase chain/domain